MEPQYDTYFSECSHCRAPRQLVEMVYGEDLLVFQQRGSTKPEDALALCRYCSDIKTRGMSKLRPLEPFTVCDFCKEPSWDYYPSHGRESLCARCAFRFDGVFPGPMERKRLVIGDEGVFEGMEMWKFILMQMIWLIDKNAVFQAMKLIIEHYEQDTDHSELVRQLDEMPSPAGYVTRLVEEYRKKKDDPHEKLRSFTPDTKPN